MCALLTKASITLRLGMRRWVMRLPLQMRFARDGAGLSGEAWYCWPGARDGARRFGLVVRARLTPLLPLFPIS
jgi:hypothetical protein